MATINQGMDAQLPLPSGTITFLFSDVQGSTTIWEREPAAMQKAMTRHHAIMHAAARDNGGSVFKIIGDGFQVAFPYPAQALKAALAAQRALASETWETTQPLLVRIGLHTGPGEVVAGDYVTSHTLNRASRISSAGHGGQILLSLATEELLRGHLPDGVVLKDMGDHYLKGLTQTERIFQVNAPDLPADFPPLVSEPSAAPKLPLLLTRMHIPTPRSQWVQRPRLFERFTQLRGGQCMLLSAPAGYGKTTLLAQWIAEDSPGHRNKHYAWLTLDGADNDPMRFWSYLVTALQTFPEVNELGNSLIEMLHAPQPPALEQTLVLLLNEISRVPGELVLVLDDLHTITEKLVLNSLGFFIEHLPENLSLILVGRGEPALPLARFRMRGLLIELRAGDLRFNNHESGEFFRCSMPLDLNESQISALDQKVEGWPAGLQMAALSMEGLADKQAFILSFTGDDRYILDYLTQEILSRQPEAIQGFLLATSILEKMNASLCEVMLASLVPVQAAVPVEMPGVSAAQQTLEYLDRSNLFIVPLDNRRSWYRYHPLFADLLQIQLRLKRPGVDKALHRRAAAWFAANGLSGEAFNHAIIAGDLDIAVGLVKENLPDFVQHGEIATLLAWLKSFPPTLFASRSILCLGFAWVNLYQLHFDAAEQWSQRAGAVLAALPREDPERGEFLGQVDALLATVAINRNEHERAIELSQSALRQLPPSQDALRSLIFLNLGDAYNKRNDFSASARAFQDAMEINQPAENHTMDAIIIGSLGDLYYRLGYLRQAESVLQQAMMVEKDQLAGGGSPLLACGKPLTYLTRIYLEWNQLDEAHCLANKALEYCEKWGHPGHLLDACLNRAEVNNILGDLEACQVDLERSRRMVQELSRNAIFASPAIGYQARILQAEVRFRLLAGDQNPGQNWMQKDRIEDRLNPGWGELNEMSLLAHLCLLQGSGDRAVALIEKIQSAATRADWLRFKIQASALLAQARQKSGDTSGALSAAGAALDLAAPEGYIRLFVDKGVGMQVLIDQVRAGLENQSLHRQGQRVEPQMVYLARLLAAFPPASSGEKAPAPSAAQEKRLDSLLAGGALSERERQILRLLAAGLSNDEIASTLFLSTNTIKTHLKRIFEKLGVNNRMEAVNRAREGKLI